MQSKIRVCVDRGGTFTDCIAFVPNHIYPKGSPKPQEPFRTIVVKLLSVDPNNYQDAPREGIRRILEIATGVKHPRDKPVDTSNLELIRMGTTVATNALLERKGEPTALLITKGFGDILKIGNQARPNLFDLSIATPDVLYKQVLEVDERVTLVGYSSVASGLNVQIPEGDDSYVKGITGEWVHILKAPELEKIRPRLERIKSSGIESVAICLMHAFTFPDHELQLQELCKSIGFRHVTISSSVSPMIKLVPRGTSTTADAYLTPCIQKYLDSFFSGFDDGMLALNGQKPKVKVEFMQSDGGLVDAFNFNGSKAILSGPAGGVVGYATTSWQENGKAVIGFDMGGTSTDVSRFGGTFEHVFETITAGIPIQAPQLDINTVAAGGGSRLFFRNGMFVVGPESASAHPGPACYRKNGPLAITDANLQLGRLDPEYFPKIFGKSENEPLDKNATKLGFEKIAKEINAFLAKQDGSKQMSIDEIAYGFIKVANESMCRPIRALTEGKGFKASDHILACFGGAGGQHAFAIARSLGIHTILIHKYSSILSAYGQALADVVYEIQEPAAHTLQASEMKDIKGTCSRLDQLCRKELKQQGFPENKIETEVYLNLRYQGTDTAIMTLKPTNSWEFEKIFLENYQQEFGFTLPDRSILVDDIRIRGIGKSIATGKDVKWTTVYQELETVNRKPFSKTSHTISAYWEGPGRINTPVYLLKDVPVGSEISGPALILDNTSTIAVEPNCKAVVTSEHVVGFVGKQEKVDSETEIVCDPILLSVFGHRFMSIAEQMGRTLQKTSISTNIKERLDFSCALFGPDGGLVANAPHIPVHLGSMQEAVKWQMKHLKNKIKEGTVLLTNHPMAGGSHLPDITVITPVFDNGNIVFFVASRGHHADIGGMQAGSMPPNSRELYQEGAAIKSFQIVKDGVFDEVGITKLLVTDPAQHAGCTGSRCIKDNISDLKAQVAANNRGIQLVKSLIKEFGLSTVQAYMKFIQENAYHAVCDLLKKTHATLGSRLHAVDYMDDGTPIALTVRIDPAKGTASFDFAGTGPQVYANTNTPKSVCYSAIIYCLRCLINLDMPLNQGALGPVSISIPEGCLLNPSETAAVVGGNVLTSQRLCDVIFKAFRACSASQGCCNNLTFGKDAVQEGEGFGYYETIAGGSGAGPTWNGRSGVHTHMTNTRITDPEILERRYPVILREFSLRKNSGGAGQYRGGDGVVREIEFLEELQLSILSERRVFQPYGLNGGDSGAAGMNYLIRSTAKGPLWVNFGGKNSTIMQKGDRIRIETPGGGGYGNPSAKRPLEDVGNPPMKVTKAGGSLLNYTDSQNSV
ncbi:hypothetical protein HDV04_000230 [Boothiomyces sp. JEL0838]|nr:hypothetical protein HDV04_000230 [Boothiomyces sp. JEL0838]